VSTAKVASQFIEIVTEEFSGILQGDFVILRLM